MVTIASLATTVNEPVFNALSIGYGLVVAAAAVILCMKRSFMRL